MALLGVRYRYPEAAEEALQGVDLLLEPGETVAITGPVGSGKSTLLALLTALVQPTAGSVTVAGRLVPAVDPLALRRRVAVVPQETFLFSMTVAENIALGVETPVTPEQIRAAADAAALSADIATFPDGYDQLVGERGITLSGGQKQRLALARALVKESELLILDDALSSVDSATETEILATLGARGGNWRRTVLLVSQRTSALRLADRIVVLDGGRIVEQGSPEHLLRAGGYYARMVELQRLEQHLA